MIPPKPAYAGRYNEGIQRLDAEVEPRFGAFR
jgi:hypothetical protein